jgi:hypothetical protein
MIISPNDNGGIWTPVIPDYLACAAPSNRVPGAWRAGAEIVMGGAIQPVYCAIRTLGDRLAESGESESGTRSIQPAE